jgi:Fe-S cluster assembly protein SufD
MTGVQMLDRTTDRTITETFLEAFGERERRADAGGPSWLRELRRAAIGRFAERGLPTTRDEEWKYTSLAHLAATRFDLTVDGAGDGLAQEAVAPFCVGPPSWVRLVFVNGRYVAKLSAIPSLPAGARVGSLAGALITDEEMLRSQLTVSVAEPPGPAFAALNAAFWRDGAFLHLPAGVSLEAPVHLLFVATAPEAARADHPRSLIVLEPGSQAVLVESYVALAEDAYLTNAVTEIVLGPGTDLDHHKVALESGRGFHVGRTQVRQARDTRFASCAIAFGGRLVRNEVSAVLGGEGAECRLSGLSVIGGRQHVDTHTVVDHAQPRATSRQLYKGVLDGRARAVFDGRVIVRPGANGTDAHQTNKNLLLSDGVEVDSKPQLEIFADDVKCSHGAADGQLAEEAIFYLKSRGLDEAASRTLLTRGFANEVLARIRVEPIRAWCEGLLTGRLRDGRVVEAES